MEINELVKRAVDKANAVETEYVEKQVKTIVETILSNKRQIVILADANDKLKKSLQELKLPIPQEL